MPLAHVRQVLARAAGVEQLDLAAHRARRLERVVDGRELGVQQVAAGVAVHRPQILVGGDVGEVPGERAHQRIDLALERVVVEVGDEGEGPIAGRREVGEQVGGGR